MAAVVVLCVIAFLVGGGLYNRTHGGGGRVGQWPWRKDPWS